MSDRSDKELSRHIRAVFDAYDEPYDPAGWRKLQRRRRGKAAVVYLRWVGAAASVAVLIAAGMLILDNPFTSPSQRQALEQRQDQTLPDESGGDVLPSAEQTEEELPVAAVPAGTGRQQTTSNDAAVSLDAAQFSEEVISAQPAAGRETAPEVFTAPGSRPLAAGGQLENQNDIAASGALAGTEKIPEGKITEAEPAGNSGEIVAAADPVADPASGSASGKDAAGIASSEAAPFPRAEDLASAGDDPEAAKYPAYEEPAEESASSGRFSVGFVTTSLMNYASGNTGSQVHFGAGITSGWKLSERLSLHSGVILAENSLSLNNSNASVQASAYASPASNKADLTAVGKNSIVQNVSPQAMDVNLLVMDVPLNLTYRLGVGKTELLLTGGLSSFAYLDQEYSYHNTVQLYTNASVAAPEPVVRDEKAFSHFDLARQLNLAIGTEVQLGKGSVLIVEPYVKYPLGELTSEHIRFGSAGMNLRLSFQTGN